MDQDCTNAKQFEVEHLRAEYYANLVTENQRHEKELKSFTDTVMHEVRGTQ